jgi:formate dehydrogenase subunit gamma
MKKYLLRYQRSDRINHWVVAVLFVCAGLSGLSLFHPSLFFLSNLFGGGPWTRFLHPFLGLLMVIGFARLYAHFWRDNVLTDTDRTWNRHLLDLLRGDKGNMPPAGRYNAGQKAMFWTFAGSLLLLLITGFIFWRPWFVGYFPIWLIRIAVVVHAASAVVLIVCVIVHVYAAIWVKGTVRAMTRGTVSEAWARQNHPLWHGEMTRRE